MSKLFIEIEKAQEIRDKEIELIEPVIGICIGCGTKVENGHCNSTLCFECWWDAEGRPE